MDCAEKHLVLRNTTLSHLAVGQASVKYRKSIGYVKRIFYLLFGHRNILPKNLAYGDGVPLNALTYNGQIEVIQWMCEANVVDCETRRDCQSHPLVG